MDRALSGVRFSSDYMLIEIATVILDVKVATIDSRFFRSEKDNADRSLRQRR